MRKIKIFIIIVLFLISVNCIFADVNSDLRNRTNQLNKLKSNINSKKAEKERLLKEEKKVKRELKKISSSMAETERQLKSLQVKIKDVEKKLQVASRQYYDADKEKQSAAQLINKEYLSYTKRKTVKYFDCPLEFKMRYLSIKDKSDKYNAAKNKEQNARFNIGKYDRTKNKFLDLKTKQQKLMDRNIKLQKDKNKLLKTTAGKRVKAEQDIRDLNDSAKALESLVNKLMKASKNKKKITSLRSPSSKRKNNLPWPADGAVILNYGKNKHPDLNTNVISNGIKIKTKNNAIIKAVDEGVVVFTGEFRSYGKMIIIDHKGVFFSVYGQLGSILVSEDQKVVRGGTVAKTGVGGNAVVYFEIRQYNVPEDPALWLMEKK